MGYKTRRIRKAGYKTRRIRKVGYKTRRIRKVGYKTRRIRKVGYKTRRIRKVGYKTRRIRKAGYKTRRIRKVGYKTRRIRKAGYKTRRNRKAFFKRFSGAPRSIRLTTGCGWLLLVKLSSGTGRRVKKQEVVLLINIINQWVLWHNKKGALKTGPTRKKNLFCFGSEVKKRGLPPHIPVLDIYMSAPPPPEYTCIYIYIYIYHILNQSRVVLLAKDSAPDVLCISGGGRG